MSHWIALSGGWRAVLISNFALVAGFLVLSFSHFIPLVHFGLLVSVAMLGGLVGKPGAAAVDDAFGAIGMVRSLRISSIVEERRETGVACKPGSVASGHFSRSAVAQHPPATYRKSDGTDRPGR